MEKQPSQVELTKISDTEYRIYDEQTPGCYTDIILTRGKWVIYNHSSNVYIKALKKAMRFDTLDLAVEFINAITIGCDTVINNIELPVDIINYLNSRAKALNESENALRSQFMEIHEERRKLYEFAKRMKINDLNRKCQLSDVDLLVDELLNYEFGDTPFFSEQVLYNLIGKEAARDILALLGNLCQRISPTSERVAQL